MLTSKDLAELFAETPPCETCEIAKDGSGRGFQLFRNEYYDAKLAKLLNDDDPVVSQISHVSQSCELVGEPTYKPFLAISLISQGGAANDDELMTDQAAQFWETFSERVRRCDRLIHRLCDLRRDTDAERADLLAVRRRVAPAQLDGDIEYLAAEIAKLAPITQTRGRCIECVSFVRVGIGQRCAHPDRSPAGEPERADCLPAHQCERFIHWRAKP
jgi:hypothetical protein